MLPSTIYLNGNRGGLNAILVYLLCFSKLFFANFLSVKAGVGINSFVKLVSSTMNFDLFL